MSTGDLIGIFRDAIFTGMKVAGPILLISMLVGLIISIIQAATSINEQTMTFVPKLIITALLMIVAGGWMLREMMDLVMRIFELIATKI
jgi:flagellar biosynthetic protein FliQ